MGWQRAGHDRAALHTHMYTHTYLGVELLGHLVTMLDISSSLALLPIATFPLSPLDSISLYANHPQLKT